MKLDKKKIAQILDQVKAYKGKKVKLAWEWRQYQTSITDWELKRYFEIV